MFRREVAYLAEKLQRNYAPHEKSWDKESNLKPFGLICLIFFHFVSLDDSRLIICSRFLSLHLSAYLANLEHERNTYHGNSRNCIHFYFKHWAEILQSKVEYVYIYILYKVKNISVRN